MNKRICKELHHVEYTGLTSCAISLDMEIDNWDVRQVQYGDSKRLVSSSVIVGGTYEVQISWLADGLLWRSLGYKLPYYDIGSNQK
jgi:hypothetical protein